MLHVRPELIDGESWAGYLMRLASRNQMPGLQSLGVVLGLSWQELLVQPPISVLPALGIDWQSTTAAVLSRGQESRHRVNLPSAGRTRRSRVCPSCLASDKVPYLRAAWEMPMAMTCLAHDELLLDRCNRCHRDLDMLRPSVGACLCGARLAGQPSHLAPGWLRRLAMIFVEADLTRTVPTFGRASLIEQEAARTCNWIVAPVDASSRKRPRRVIDREGFLTSETLSALEPMLLNWPSALAATLECECNSTKSNGSGFAALNHRLAVRKFAAMREVVDSVKMAIPPDQRPWSERNRQRAVPANRTSYGIKHLIKATGHSYGGLVASIDAGQFPGASYTFDPATGRKKFNIPESVFYAAVKHFRESCDVQGAAQFLGCSEDAIRGLVQSKCIASATVLQGGFRYRLSPVELSKMAARLFGLASRVSKGLAVDRVYFSAWVQGPYRTETAGRWRVLLEAIRTNDLKVYSADATPVQLSDLYLLSADLERALSRARAGRKEDLRQSGRAHALAVVGGS